MAITHYKDLGVWQKSMDLAVEIFKVARWLPKEELYGLSDQMRRAVVSVPSNIAEGQQRSSTRDYIRFLHIAKGSLGELETQIMLCERLEYLGKDKTDQLIKQCIEIQRMISGLINSLMSVLNKENLERKKACENENNRSKGMAV